MASQFMNLRKELDELGYKQTLKIECLPLVSKLLSDLKTTTENLQKYMTISKNALDEINNLELCAEPYKCDNAKLIKECNDLHLAFIHFKEQHEKVQRDLRMQNAILEDRVAECETEKENLRQQIKKLKADFKSNLKNFNRIPKSSLGKSTKEFMIESTMSCADERISTLQKEMRKLKENQIEMAKNNEFLKSQLDNRNQEIQRLSTLLEGGRPQKPLAKDCCYKNIDNKIGALQDEIRALKAEKSVLDAQLKEALAKQHEAMRRALHLAERNKRLEKEMKDIDQIALQVEAECNNTVRNNSEKVHRLQDKLNESMMKTESLERDVAKLKQEKMSLQADLDALKLEKRHLQTALESETEDKKRLTDRINNLTIIEHDLNMEIDRLVRLTGEQKLKIAELEVSKKHTRGVETEDRADRSPNRTKKSGPSKKSTKKSTLKEVSKTEAGHSKVTKCCCEAGGCVKRMIELLNKEMEYRQEQASQQMESLKQEKEYYMKEYHKIADELRSGPDIETYNRIQRQYDELLKKIEERNQTIVDLQKEIKLLTGNKYGSSRRDEFENGDTCQKTCCKRKQRELELHRDEVKQLQRENDSLKNRIQELNQSTIFDQERMKKAFQDMEEHIRKLEDERRDLVVNQLTSRTNLTHLEEECNTLRDKLRATQNELNSQKASYDQLKNLHEQANFALSESRNQLAGTERELQAIQSKISNSHRETAGQEREVTRLQNDIEVMKKHLTKLDKEKDDLLNVLDEKTEKIDSLEEQLREKKNVISTLESEMKDLKRKLSKFSEENDGCQLELKGAKQELNALQKDYDSVVRTRDAALQENRRLQDDLASVAADCKDARRELEISKRQIEDVKRQLQHYVAEVKRFEDQISQKELERAEILDQFKSLSAEAVSLETTNHTLENEAAQSKVQLSVALDHASDLERKLENKDAIIRSYEKQIADLSSQVATLEIQLKQRNAQYEKMEDELRQMKDLCVQLDREKDELRREFQNREDRTGMTQRNIEMLSRENDDLKRSVAKDRNNVEGLEKLLNDARQEVIEQKLINQDLQSELTRMKTRLEEVQERLNITSEQLDLYQEKALEYSQQNKQLRREIANERFFRSREEDNKRYPSL
ncbi:unnamed protein product [Acanthoscelides obtectus]|uniref:Centrosomal protein of 135 kDa n=2 Tax=Acanthoscelides obtectus TaxID=200917 RepID=A0A9P0P4G7_ACAOB|nr:unnamed protein product [Acanthoscelides obtectus]CAK1629339.1 Centrosomal protein of 135 kDa [Acanthoscelides obtectus]